MSVEVFHADMLDWLAEYAEAIGRGEAEPFDACVTDPPYHLSSIVKRFGPKGSAPAKVGATGAYARASRGFMGKAWDGGDVAFRAETWQRVLAVLKPGAHLVAFSGTRTYHRMACAIEDAGFEIRDQLAWCYGSGFPKSHDCERAAAELTCGAPGRHYSRTIPPERDRQPGDHVCAITPESEPWQGWGTALKPAWEPICLARKPVAESSVATNVLAHGCGALNIDGCRVGFAGDADEAESKGKNRHADFGSGARENRVFGADTRDRGEHGNYDPPGRWPANLLHDGSPDVVAGFPSDVGGHGGGISGVSAGFHGGIPPGANADARSIGSAARFFYSAKAGPLDRLGSAHATVKPVDVMRWLVRLVTPPGGTVLDPFAGSRTTGIACLAEGFDCTLIELEADHVADIERKLAFLRGEGRNSLSEHLARKAEPAKAPSGGLFDAIEDAA